MAKPTKSDKAISNDIESLRKEAIKKFFGLAPKIYEHIQDSIKATKPCTSCSREGENHKPGKAVDTDGKCAMCHGSYLVPDLAQRNWATEQAQPIVAPAPKQVEMSVEQTSTVPELEEKVKGLSAIDLDRKLEVLGLIDEPEPARA